MAVISARYAAPPPFPGFTQFILAMTDESDDEIWVPEDELNRYYQMVLDWEFGPLEDVDGFMVRPTTQVNFIEPYVPPGE